MGFCDIVTSAARRLARRETSALRGSGLKEEVPPRDGDFTANAFPSTAHVASRTAPGLNATARCSRRRVAQ